MVQQRKKVIAEKETMKDMWDILACITVYCVTMATHVTVHDVCDSND